jgi:hypothetical protein
VEAMGDDRPEFLSALAADANDSLAAVEPGLAQPSIGSQLIDNLDAPVNLRAFSPAYFCWARH